MMNLFKLPNRLFIKLLLGFWLCSSLIFAIVAALPLLQKNHDQMPLPDHLKGILVPIAKDIQENPARLTNNYLRKHQHHTNMRGKPLRLYLVDEKGLVINTDRVPIVMRQFFLMAEEAQKPISHQFKEDLAFGPYNFTANNQDYALYGRLPFHHPMPWFFFFIKHKMLTLSLAILLSGLLCAVLAWHLGKPLLSLQHSANALAQGKLDNRVNEATVNRNDEMGELAKSFNTMADAIEEMMMAQQRLISDISHELRTPLTRLQLALALSRKKEGDSKELQRIAYEADQLEQMIAELLELSRIKLKEKESKRSVELAESLGQILDDAEFEAAQQQKQLFIDIPETIVIPIYPRPLSRAIENLLRNAIKYSKTTVSIIALEQPDQTDITIIDDGPGVAEEELEAIFEPFYRPQRARERESGGWGLGLAIAQAAITAHGGKIVAENVPKGGLSVKISLLNT